MMQAAFDSGGNKSSAQAGSSPHRHGLRALLYAAGLGVSLLSLGGCAMDVDTRIAQKHRAELAEGAQNSNVPTASLNAAALQAVGDHYRGAGNGPVELVVTYDPRSQVNTAARAAREADRIQAALARKGVGPIEADILPVHGQGDISRTMINYGTLVALPPSNCSAMPGLDGRQTEADLDYKMGCSVETQFARQIANPRDLLGKEGMDTADGRRQSNIVGVWMAAEPLQPLEGQSATTGTE